MNRIIQIICTTLLFANAAYAAEVKNIVSKQEGNRVVFEYDIVGEEQETEVIVTLTVEGKTYKAKDLHLEGDYGNVKPGKKKIIYWNVLQDFPMGFSGDIGWEIVAGGFDYTETVTGMEFVYVKGGCFQMGGALKDGESDEKPVHEVCVDNFYIGKYEVTQKQWRNILGHNTSNFSNCGGNCPVEKVSWEDVQDYISKLNQKTEDNYRLPTEAEWEYACQSGGKEKTNSGNSDADSVAWHLETSGRKIHPVGTKQPNKLELYDMYGNVWEWVSDWYHEKYYEHSPRNNPKGPGEDWTHLEYRVFRGGSWSSVERNVRCADRDRITPFDNRSFLGFRLARTP